MGVARALAADPPVMLMDEPFGAVDPIARERLQDEFLALHARVRKTVVLVTHDIDEAVKLGDRIAVLKQGGFWSSTTGPLRCWGSPPATSWLTSWDPTGPSNACGSAPSRLPR